MRKSSSHQLQQLDAFFAAQHSPNRVRRILLSLGVMLGAVFWLATFFAVKPPPDQAALTVLDPFAEILPTDAWTPAASRHNQSESQF